MSFFLILVKGTEVKKETIIGTQYIHELFGVWDCIIVILCRLDLWGDLPFEEVVDPCKPNWLRGQGA